MFKKFLTPKKILIIILLLSAFLRLFRLDYPNKYVFDEVYHSFTAKEFLAGSKVAWEWWTTPPPGVAYEWTHPPLAKEIMVFSMLITHSNNAWAYRLPGVLFGILSVYLVYLLGLKLFKNKTAALISGFVFSIDGLNFVQSRTGMNDIYHVCFMLVSILFILNRKFFLSAVFWGLALSSKWAAIYLLPMYFVMAFYFFATLKSKMQQLRFYFGKIILIGAYFIFIPPFIYLLSYLPFFLPGHTFEQFIQLQQQMWWYHTNLKATHDYTSPWWSWPLNLYPVWYFVDYGKDTIANIFASGNPIVFWVGTVTVVLTALQAIKEKSFNLFIVVLGFLIFWLPWAISPRIMFLYHFSPSVPFLSLALGYQLSLELENSKRKKAVYILLFLIALSFILIFPYLTGIPIPKDFVNLFFLMNLAKNPFN